MCHPGWVPEKGDVPEAELRLMRNCDGTNPDAKAVLGFPFAPDLFRCPWSAIEPVAWELQQIWHDWRTLKLLPFPGGIRDQPAWVVEVIQLCETTLIEVQNQPAPKDTTFADALTATKSRGVDGAG